MNVYTCTHLSLNISVFLLTILVTFIMILFLIKTQGNVCYMCILCEYWGLKLYSLTHVTGTRNENYSFWMKLVKFKYSQTFSCFVMCVVVLSAILRSVLWSWEANHPSLSSQTVTWTELWDRSECIITLFLLSIDQSSEWPKNNICL